MKLITKKISIIWVVSFILMHLPVSAQTSLRQPKVENDILNEHFMDIVNATNSIEKESIVKLWLKYKIPKSKKKALVHFVNERERRKQCYNYIWWVLSIPFFISCIRQQNPLTVLSKIILRKVKQFNLPPQKK